MRFLADGVTEELILELGRFRRLFISSRTASAVLQNENRDPVAIGDALGVRYVLSGNLRRKGSKVRINLSLAETAEGHIVWNDRIERPFETLLDTVDEIVGQIAATVMGRLRGSRYRGRPPAASRIDVGLRMPSCAASSFTASAASPTKISVEAIKWFDRAIEADPNFGRPYAMQVCAVAGLAGFRQ